MAVVPATSRGVPSSGGTFTGPVTVDLSGDAVSRRALHVILPEAFDFSVDAFTFEIANQFGILRYDTNARVTTAGNQLRTGGGAIVTENGLLNTGSGAVTTRLFTVQGVGPVLQVSGTDGTVSFFNVTPVTQPAAPTTLPEVIAALKALGLVAT